MENLIPSEVLSQYEEEIEKARDILQFLDYVKDNGLDYSASLEQIVGNHRV